MTMLTSVLTNLVTRSNSGSHSMNLKPLLGRDMELELMLQADAVSMLVKTVKHGVAVEIQALNHTLYHIMSFYLMVRLSKLTDKSINRSKEVK